MGICSTQRGTYEQQLGDYAAYPTELTASVGTVKFNDLGLYDMYGNVSEWMEDCWHEDYREAPTDGSAWLEPGNCGVRVIRGGSLGHGPPVRLRPLDRSWNHADGWTNFLGFRLVQDIAE